MSDYETTEARYYHAMCKTLWEVVDENGEDDCATIAAAEIARLRERVMVLELFQTEAIAARSILGLKGSLGFAHKFEADSIWAGYRNARNAATDAAKAMEDA